MKSKILALTALLTIGMAAPVAAETVIDFGVSNRDGAGIVVAPFLRRDRDYYPYYRSNWEYGPRYRIYRSYDDRYDGFYSPYYGLRDRPHYRYGRRHYYGRRYYPRSYLQFRIGF